MGIWHEEIEDWVLTYDKKREGRKDVLSATNPDRGIYLSADEQEGIQDPLETLYRSLEHPENSELPEREELDERDLTKEGLETLEQSIRERTFNEVMRDGKEVEKSRYDDEEIADKKHARYDHEIDS